MADEMYSAKCQRLHELELQCDPSIRFSKGALANTLGARLLRNGGPAVNSKYVDTKGNTLMTIFEMKALSWRGKDYKGRTIIPRPSRNLRSGFELESEIFETLVQLGVSIDQEDKLGITPLMGACSRDFVEFVELLISHGANVNKKWSSGSNGSNGFTALHFASKMGLYNDCSKLLLQNGADPNAKDDFGKSALVVQFLTYIDALEEYGENDKLEEDGGNCVCDVDGMDRGDPEDPETDPDDDLCSCQWMHIMKSFCLDMVGHGIDIDAADVYGDALVHEFTWGQWKWKEKDFHTKKPKALELLVKFGANVDLKNPFMDLTPLQHACMDGKVLLARELIKSGANVNSKGRLGQTALHYAAMAGHTNCVQLLIGHGADVSVCDSKEESPIDKAERWGRAECLEMLQKANRKALKRNSEELNNPDCKLMKTN